MDKLLSHRFNENKTSKHRRTSKNNDKGDNLEAVENCTEKREEMIILIFQR